MDPKSDDLSDKTIRRIVKKDSISRLRTELLGCQSLLTQTEIDSLPRATLVGYVTLIRQLNKSSNACRNKIPDFDPKNSIISEGDDEEIAKSKSLSDDLILGEGSSLSKSHTMTQSIGSTIEFTSDIAKSIDFLIAMQREERIERQRKEDQKELKERELSELKEKKERELSELKEKKERELLELKEKKERELIETRERKEKEDRDERWRIEREDKKERERVREERRIEREERDRKDKEEKEAKEQRIKDERETKEQKEK